MLFFRVNKLFRSSGSPCPASITTTCDVIGVEFVAIVSELLFKNIILSSIIKTIKKIKKINLYFLKISPSIMYVFYTILITLNNNYIQKTGGSIISPACLSVNF